MRATPFALAGLVAGAFVHSCVPFIAAAMVVIVNSILMASERNRDSQTEAI